MIKALIQNGEDKMLLLTLPSGRMKLAGSLTYLGINKPASEISCLADDENGISVKLFGDDAVDNKIILAAKADTSFATLNTACDLTETRVTVKRKMRADEMTEAQFDMIKPILDEETRTSFNQDWLETYQNVCFDALEETDLACVPSPEAEMIDELDKREIEETEEHNPLRRTSENGMSILSEILNEKQIEYFIEHHQNELSARKIAEKYGVAHTTVSRALKVIDKKIKKYFQTHGKICSKTPEKSI